MTEPKTPPVAFDTLAVHAGTPQLTFDGAHPTAPPLVPASSFWYDSAEQLDRVLGDSDRKVAKLYDMIHPEANDTLAVRSVFFIDPNKKIRAMITYPASTGRNFGEILRVIDSLQLTDSHKVATPADWQNGDDCVIVPAIQDADELKQRFPKGYTALRPYLRMTPQPNK